MTSTMTGVEVAFGDRLKVLRTAAGLSQHGLAMAAGLTAKSVAAIEQGAVKDPSWSTAVKLAAALGVTLDELRDTEAAAIPPPDEPPAPKKGRKPKGK